MAKSTENELKATRMMQENSVSKQMKDCVSGMAPRIINRSDEF